MKLETLLWLWTEHGTKVLGYAQTVVPGIILLDGFKSKWWLLANVLLAGMTVRRGHVNTKSGQ